MENEEFNIFYIDAESELKELRKLCSQRGAKMQILYEIMSEKRVYGPNIANEIDGWFDKDGVPL